MGLTCLVLSAGRSRRMGGRHKALLPWRGATVLDHLRSLFEAHCEEHLLVVRPGSAWTAPFHGVYRIVENPSAELGMFSSVKAGIAATDADGVLVTPVDCFVYRAETVEALVRAFETTGRTVVPTHRGRRGHPVLLGPTALAMVRAAAVETNLAEVLARCGDTLELPVEDPGILVNVNEPHQYEALLLEAGLGLEVNES